MSPYNTCELDAPRTASRCSCAPGVIDDGDSSVMANIRQYVVYGPFVEKVECANHACKCYRNRLEELAKDHPEFRGRGGLTKRAMQQLTTGVRVAIKMHSETGDVQQLRKDLRNGPAHVFGDHTNCNVQFCKHVPGHSSQQDNQAEDSSNPAEEVIDDQHYSDLREQLDAIIGIETEETTTSLQEEQEAQNGHESSLETLPRGLYDKVLACGDRLVMLAPKLISNQTSNLAECYMSVRCCFDGGKQYN